MNQSELVKKVAEATGIPQTKTKVVLEATIEAIKNELLNDGSVALNGLGAFKSKRRAAHTAISPKTRETVNVPEKRKVTFGVFEKFRQEVAVIK